MNTRMVPQIVPLVFVLLACSAAPLHPAEPGAATVNWTQSIAQAVTRIDAAMPGDLGVHVRKPGGASAGVYDNGGERRWYLSSTVKIPVAIAVLELVDAGRLTLDERLTLAASDLVDGAGDLARQRIGSQHTIAQLLARSLEDSDSTATDMLIRRIGEDHLNSRVRAWTGGGFGPMTTILQVRYDVYGALHPGVAQLDNAQIVALRSATAGEPRLQALARTLGVPRDALGSSTFDEAFEAYYRTGTNSATLEAFANLLGKLAAGELLSAASTRRMLDHMRSITTGDRRVMAGLPAGTDFAQKTGTQIRRACNVGLINAGRGPDGAVILVACAEQYEALQQAETAFQELGKALVVVLR